MSNEVQQRKIEHVNIALNQDVSAEQRAGWHDVHLIHQALPEVDLDAIDTSTSFLGYPLRYPIVISALTGGHPDVININRNLARAAQNYGLALGVGSQRAAIVNPALASSYSVTRETAPDAVLIANIGAPQLIQQARHAPFTLSDVQSAIAMIQANALAVHMNSLQEATQPEGDRKAVGEIEALTRLTGQVNVPVIAKETGAGICREQAFQLLRCGVSALDVGGAGGSSMSVLEMARAQAQGDEQHMQIGQIYRDWGIATPISVIESATAGLPLIGTGGIRTGLDMARAISLGATLVGVGYPFLKAASESYEKVEMLLEQLIGQLKIAMQLSGAQTIAQLQKADVVVTGPSREWLDLRGFLPVLQGLARRRWQRLHPGQ